MSTPLTEAAPAPSADDPTVVDPAPVATSEVDEGSGLDGVVPVERFNGLMSSLGKAQAQVAERDAELEALRAELATSQPPKEVPVAEPTGTESPELLELRQMVVGLQEQLAGVAEHVVADQRGQLTRQLVEEFPDVEPLADFIVANSADEARQLAQELAERVRVIRGQAPTATEPVVTEQAPAPQGQAPATGAGVAYVSDPPTNERAEAIRKGDFAGWMEAKAREAMGARDSELVLNES